MKRVLIVDDDATIRNLIADALREVGYEVDTAANGMDALQRMRRHRPDAVVLDLMMPKMDGMTFTRLMRLNPRLAQVPVIVVTATYAPQIEADELGAQALLTKPFQLEDLMDVVGRLTGAVDALPTSSLAESPGRGLAPPAAP